MTYTINRFNSTKLVDVEDGRINDDYTHIKFVGRNYAGYGEVQNENFLWLLENFASTSEPTKKITGMIWYDSSNKKLKFYDGAKFKTTGGAEVSSTQPTGLAKGDFWYNTNTNQMFAYDPDYGANNGYVLIGPLAVAGKAQTNFESVQVTGTDNNTYAITKAVVNGSVVFIISTASFTLKSSVNTIDGFSYIREGITLVNTSAASDTSPGVTSTAFRLWGTASDSDRLGGIAASQYLQKNSSGNSYGDFPNAGIRVGDNHDIKIFIDTGSVGTILNQVSNSLTFKTTDSGNVVRTPMVMNNLDVIPGADLVYNLGTSVKQWKEIHGGDIYATTFHGNLSGAIDGIAAKADRTLINDSATDPAWSTSHYRTAMTTATAYTIAARDSAGDLTANVFHGTATSARYADLAERYEADSVYEPGTVLVFGGEKEVTITSTVADTRVAGVVSTNPAYLMNAEAGSNDTHPPVALKGKIPVKVFGPVKKGDVLVTSFMPGFAEVAQNPLNVLAASIVGKSLEDREDNGSGLIMVVV